MFDKITSRIQKLCYGLNADFVDPVSPPALTPLLLGKRHLDTWAGIPGVSCVGFEDSCGFLPAQDVL